MWRKGQGKQFQSGKDHSSRLSATALHRFREVAGGAADVESRLPLAMPPGLWVEIYLSRQLWIFRTKCCMFCKAYGFKGLGKRFHSTV